MLFNCSAVLNEKCVLKAFYRGKFIIWQGISPLIKNTNLIGLGGSIMAQARLHNEVMVAYDIEDSKNRTKLFKKLKDISLKPIQKSVFWGHLNKAEEDSVQRLLKEYCQKTDKAFIARVALSEQVNQNNSIGYDKDDFPKNPHEYYVL
jgi:CRISPR-associated protein Cas2